MKIRESRIAFSVILFSALSTAVLLPNRLSRVIAFDPRLLGRWAEDPILVYAPDQSGNPPSVDIRELMLERGSFSITWRPFCTYKDYWGKAVVEADAGLINLTIRGGNYVPSDFKGRGRYRFGPEGELIITDVSFGTKDIGSEHTYIFRRRP